MSRPNTIRSSVLARAALALALAVAVGPAGASAPLLAADGTPEPASLHEAILYHLQFATNINGTPIDEGNSFVEGIPRVLTLVGWDYVPSGTQLRMRVFQGDRLVLDEAKTVRIPQDGGFVFNFEPPGGVQPGVYLAQLDYNGVPDEVATFVVLPRGYSTRGHGTVQGAGNPIATGPVPYADPRSVLVVTRTSVLRRTLGARTDEVLAAAARVGDVRDLESDGVVRGTPEAAAEETRRLLRAGGYRYLLILGNDDVVPFAHVTNPVGASEKEALDGWELPAEWVPSDNPYGDLDGDRWGVPDLAVARLPSSDDADLLLVQLGDNQPPDGGGFALVNQKRRNMAGAVLETMDEVVPVSEWYSPPTYSDGIPDTPAAQARYTYILLHGIGVTTDEWYSDRVAWTPVDLSNLAGDWKVRDAGQEPAMSVARAGIPGGIVNVGACYGAWTLDTIQAPQHKTADNNLALAYLKSGTRAFVADTHLSYSSLIGADGTPVARTGFEVLFWKALLAGASPIDAFQAAKVGIAKALDAAIEAGNAEDALLNLKTLEIMVYLGRP